MATYNVSLFGKRSGEIARRLDAGDDRQAQSIARVIASVDPDILLICEIDHDAGVAADEQPVAKLVRQYLLPQTGGVYQTIRSLPSNTGLISGLDLNNDDRVSLPQDGWGFGRFEGQYAFAVVSRYELDDASLRTFQNYLWSQFRPDGGPVMPDGRPYYSPQIWRRLRLSSKNHVDLPFQTPRGTVHLLASHPTPPVFDGPEDRNGLRNADEIQFWTQYVDRGTSQPQIIDDAGCVGGLATGQSFVIAGDLNSDPLRGESDQSAIRELTAAAAVTAWTPTSSHGSDATAYFGNRPIRVDYVIPSSDLRVVGGGVVDPLSGPLLVDVKASDHRLVWIDVDFNQPRDQ